MPHSEDAPLQALTDTAVDGIGVIETRGFERICTGACEKLSGYRPDEVVGQNVKMFMPEPYDSERDAHIASYLRTAEKRIVGIGCEVVGCRKDRTIFPMGLSVGEGTTKEMGKGIGLAICQSKVEAHGGSILALPNVVPGAAFGFCVPFVGQREAA